uniref:Uncharacterized protein n=1 Tax=Rhizophora mucronata TaxID=61149 RepID=A0A2P2P7X0_RHIMU
MTMHMQDFKFIIPQYHFIPL